jgi:NAD(P)-dependent dehydrogenase (short-subunit alcohol dehydrogenase family)
VLSTQRVNRAALPQLRKQRNGLVVWISSSSAAGGTPPYLAPYFAAKAGMDALAVIYARELSRWGIETSIIVPGAFTGGTNHLPMLDRQRMQLAQGNTRQVPTRASRTKCYKGFLLSCHRTPMCRQLRRRSSGSWTRHLESVLFASTSILPRMVRKW